jgi:hypothetical protein
VTPEGFYDFVRAAGGDLPLSREALTAALVAAGLADNLEEASERAAAILERQRGGLGRF